MQKEKSGIDMPSQLCKKILAKRTRLLAQMGYGKRVSQPVMYNTAGISFANLPGSTQQLRENKYI